MNDDAGLQLDFLRQREAELRKELRDAEASFGEAINESNVGRIAMDVAEALRRSGNEPLAARYLAAFECWRLTTEAVEHAMRAGDVNESVTDAMNDAVDDFERLGAAASAWFDSLDEKGGA